MSVFDLAGRKALVTGGARGLGAAVGCAPVPHPVTFVPPSSPIRLIRVRPHMQDSAGLAR